MINGRNQLPIVLLGIRAAWREDLKSTTAELVYGEPLRLPGEFLTPRVNSDFHTTSQFVAEMKRHFQKLKPVPGSHQGDKQIFVYKDLATCEQVLVRFDGPKKSLQDPYHGPYPVSSSS